MYHLAMVIADYALMNMGFLQVPNLPVDLMLGMNILKTYNFFLDIKKTIWKNDGSPKMKRLIKRLWRCRLLENTSSIEDDFRISLLRACHWIHCRRSPVLTWRRRKNKFQEVEKLPKLRHHR